MAGPARSERLRQRKRALAESLLARTGAAGSETKLAARGRALLLAEGGPVRQDEYWKYTDPAPLLAAPEPAPEPAPPFASLSGPVLVLGGERPEVTGEAPAGLDILADAGDGVPFPGDPVPRPLAALNAAACRHSVLLRVTAPIEAPLRLVHAAPARGGIGFTRVAIRVEAGARLEVLETAAAGAARNLVLDARVARGGRLDHVRIQAGATRREYAAAFVRLETEATYAGFSLAVDGEVTRNETVLHLAGEGARGHVAGGLLGAGSSHLDMTVLVHHAAEQCQSRQVVRSVLDGRARGVFQGKVLVDRVAQRTDGYQISQTLLLDRRAEFDVKPELEIYADDVRCSHGATIGAVDEEALFYLRSRGIGRGEAEAMLIAAFLEEALAEIDRPASAEAVRAVAGRWLAGRREAA